MVVNPDLLETKCFKCGKDLEKDEFIYCFNCDVEEINTIDE